LFLAQHGRSTDIAFAHFQKELTTNGFIQTRFCRLKISISLDSQLCQHIVQHIVGRSYCGGGSGNLDSALVVVERRLVAGIKKRSNPTT